MLQLLLPPPVSLILSDVVLEAMAASEGSFCLSQSQLCLSNPLPQYWTKCLGLDPALLFLSRPGSVSKFPLQSTCVEVEVWVSYISEICSAFIALGKYVLCLNCCRWQTLLFYILQYLQLFCFSRISIFRPLSPLHYLASALPQSHLVPSFHCFSFASAVLPRPLPQKSHASTTSLLLLLQLQWTNIEACRTFTEWICTN